MKGWISGLVVGIVVGSALARAAQGQWQSATKILQETEEARIAYIEGVNDALGAIAGPPALSDTSLKVLTTCLDTHTRDAAGEFLRWADGVLHRMIDSGYGSDGAASFLIANACR